MGLIITGGATGRDADVDLNGALLVNPGNPSIGSVGGFYTVAGQQSAAIAATLAASTLLMSMRMVSTSTRKAYFTRLRVQFGAVTVGASALIPGTLGLQRFTAQTPTGGVARTANRHDETLGTATDITDIRDSNAALTGTAPTFGNVVAASIVPIFITSGPMVYEWIYEPNYPTILGPGDGLALRTQVVMPGTQTWVYSYDAEWYEK